MIRNLYFLIAAFTLIFISSNNCFASSQFQPQPLSACDGAGWCGLVFGKTTANDVKRLYDTDKHHNIPRSLRLAQPDNVDYQINVLFSGKKDSDPVSAILVRYNAPGRDLNVLINYFGSNSAVYYPATRYENWHVLVNPDKGIAAFIMDNNGQETIHWIIMAPPSVFKNGFLGLPTERSDISDYIDPHRNEPKVMRFGFISVSSTIDNFRLDDYMKRSIRRHIREANASGTMVYEPGSAGSVDVSLSGNYHNDKDSYFYATVKINGDGPYGNIKVEASDSDTVKKRDNPELRLFDITDSTIFKAERAFADAMRKSGPPSLEALRLDAWNSLLSSVRNLADGSLTAPTHTVL